MVDLCLHDIVFKHRDNFTTTISSRERSVGIVARRCRKPGSIPAEARDFIFLQASRSSQVSTQPPE
jgi:hypothetical protein